MNFEQWIHRTLNFKNQHDMYNSWKTKQKNMSINAKRNLQLCSQTVNQEYLDYCDVFYVLKTCAWSNYFYVSYDWDNKDIEIVVPFHIHNLNV